MRYLPRALLEVGEGGKRCCEAGGGGERERGVRTRKRKMGGAEEKGCLRVHEWRCGGVGGCQVKVVVEGDPMRAGVGGEGGEGNKTPHTGNFPSDK